MLIIEFYLFFLKSNLKRHQVQILKAIERILNQNRYHELIYSKIL